jgi:hypothetical protein
VLLALLAMPALAGDGHGLHHEVDDWAFDLHAALGAQWVARVGDDSDLARYDAFPTAQVRGAQSALDAHFSGPAGAWGTVRVEEGIFHAGGLEAGEAWIGLRETGGWIGAWIGRNDLVVTRDRSREAEDLTFSVRPVVSRTLLPQHVDGAALDLAWPERVSARAGVAYATRNADAPTWYGRLSVHPLGPVPDREDARVDGFRFRLGAGGLRMDSEGLGRSTVLAGDLELRWGPVELAGEWVRHDLDDRRREELLAEAGAALFPVGGGDVHAQARVSRATGLVDGEDARWLPAGRVTWRGAASRVNVYVEALLSREQGRAAADDEAVVVLDDSIERANDSLALGALLRW